MIARKYRFTRKNFGFLRKQMRPFRVGDFLFLYGVGRDYSRCAMIVSRKSSKTAVKRNYLRRAFYQQCQQKIVSQSLVLNVICLYKGTKILKNTCDVEQAVDRFLSFLKKRDSSFTKN